MHPSPDDRNGTIVSINIRRVLITNNIEHHRKIAIHAFGLAIPSGAVPTSHQEAISVNRAFIISKTN